MVDASDADVLLMESFTVIRLSAIDVAIEDELAAIS